MNIKVNIPVTLGGYTGQLDKWEEHTNDYAIEYDTNSDALILQAEGSVQTRIALNWPELQRALAVVSELE